MGTNCCANERDGKKADGSAAANPNSPLVLFVSNTQT